MKDTTITITVATNGDGRQGIAVSVPEGPTPDELAAVLRAAAVGIEQGVTNIITRS